MYACLRLLQALISAELPSVLACRKHYVRIARINLGAADDALRQAFAFRCREQEKAETLPLQLSNRVGSVPQACAHARGAVLEVVSPCAHRPASRRDEPV